MVKVWICNDIIKPFSGEGDVVAWLKKVRLVAKLQQVDDVASLLPLYLEADALTLYMEMDRAYRGSAERGVHRRSVRSVQESDHDHVGWRTCERLRQQN